MATKKQAITAMIYDKRGRLLSIGKNSYIKTHPYQAKLAIQMDKPQKIYLHAEIHAILKCVDITRAHKMVITRFNVDGTTANAAPCTICQRALSLTNIKIIEHT